MSAFSAVTPLRASPPRPKAVSKKALFEMLFSRQKRSASSLSTVIGQTIFLKSAASVPLTVSPGMRENSSM